MAGNEWVEQVGEIELIRGWAEVLLAKEFVTSADTSLYQVFLTSYDAVAVFVQNRTSRSFEVHAMTASQRKLPFSVRCGYRIVTQPRQSRDSGP